MRTYHILYAILIICSGCVSKNRESTPVDSLSVDTLSVSRVSDLAKFEITDPSCLTSFDKYILLHTSSDIDNQLHLFDVDLNPIGHGVLYGSGPSDILEITSINVYDSNPYIYDARKGSVYTLCIEDSLTINKWTDSIPLMDNVMVVDKDRLIVATVQGDYSYALINKSKSGSLSDSIAYYPPIPEGVSPQTHALACTGTMSVIPSKKIYARSVAFDGGIDFFSYSNDKISHIGRYSLFDMDYDVIPQGPGLPVPNQDSRMGFIKIVGSDDCFYASFSGKKALENPEGYANMIYKFDSQGTLLKKYYAPYEFSDFTISEKHNKIWTISTDQNNNRDMIYTYKLP